MLLTTKTIIVPKKEAVIKNNETYFYLGKDEKGNKYFFDKPKFACGWYYSINNVTVFSKNMRGLVKTSYIDDKPLQIVNETLVESVCDLEELLLLVTKVKLEADKIKTLTDPLEVYNLIYISLPKLFADLESFISNTNKFQYWQIKNEYIKQTLSEIKSEILKQEGVIRYMILNKIETFNMRTVSYHIDKLNEYRNKFILFKLFE